MKPHLKKINGYWEALDKQGGFIKHPHKHSDEHKAMSWVIDRNASLLHQTLIKNQIVPRARPY